MPDGALSGSTGRASREELGITNLRKIELCPIPTPQSLTLLCQIAVYTAESRLRPRTVGAARHARQSETASEAPKSASGRGPAACHRQIAAGAVSRAVDPVRGGSRLSADRDALF